MITIDGSEGEGGGQVLRNACALSLVTGEPFTIEDYNVQTPSARGACSRTASWPRSTSAGWVLRAAAGAGCHRPVAARRRPVRGRRPRGAQRRPRAAAWPSPSEVHKVGFGIRDPGSSFLQILRSLLLDTSIYAAAAVHI